MNAGRKYLGTSDLSGRVVLTSGLGGMSGAQPKAASICGCVGVIAEVTFHRINRGNGALLSHCNGRGCCHHIGVVLITFS